MTEFASLARKSKARNDGKASKTKRETTPMRHYAKPPLPFNGNKRNQLKNIELALHDMRALGYITDSTIFYDVFGGSGLLSHFIKRKFPKNRVIWNDFDNYQERLELIEQTDIQKQKLKEILKKHGINMEEKLPQEAAQEVREYLSGFEKLDYITLSSYIFFSSRYATSRENLLSTPNLYHKLSNSSLDKQGYLQGVERVRRDFRELIKEAYTTHEPRDVFLILDPPYIQTEKAGYSNYFGLRDFLDLAVLIRQPFIYFSSGKSEMREFVEFMEKCRSNKEVFSSFSELNYISSKVGNIKNNGGDIDYLFYKADRGLFRELAQN